MIPDERFELLLANCRKLHTTVIGQTRQAKAQTKRRKKQEESFQRLRKATLRKIARLLQRLGGEVK